MFEESHGTADVIFPNPPNAVWCHVVSILHRMVVGATADERTHLGMVCLWNQAECHEAWHHAPQRLICGDGEWLIDAIHSVLDE